MYKAAVFDFDGTLANTLHTIGDYCNQSLKKNGMPPIPIAQYRYFTGNGARHLVEEMLRYHGKNVAEWYERVYQDYNQAYLGDVCRLTTLYDGILPLLKSLKSKGIYLAVLSNKPHDVLVKTVSQFFDDALFDKVLGQSDRYPKKPDPAALLALMADFGAAPSQTLYFGDTLVDMQTGKAAGAFTVGVTWGFRDRAELEANHADLIIDSPMELFEKISFGAPHEN